MATYITLILTGATTLFGAWSAYKLKMAQISADAAKKVSDQHTTQIQEVKGLVNGALGQTLQAGLNSAQAGLTAAKALAVVAPHPENVALANAAQEDATKAQQALDAHNATQNAINASIANGVK